MLIAKTESGERIDARVAEKGLRYYCQMCDEKLILKKGDIKIHHFAHYPGANCHTWEPESDIHLSMKATVYNIIKKYNKSKLVEIEYPVLDSLGRIIPDVFIELSNGIRIAVECQVSRKSPYDILYKTYRYSKMGIYTLWIFDANNVVEQKGLHIKLSSMYKEVYSWLNMLFIIERNKVGVFRWHYYHGHYYWDAPELKEVILVPMIVMIDNNEIRVVKLMDLSMIEKEKEDRLKLIEDIFHRRFINHQPLFIIAKDLHKSKDDIIGIWNKAKEEGLLLKYRELISKLGD